MEYTISFEVPDELDALIEDPRRKWVSEKVTEFVRSLIANEASNGLERALLTVNPVIERNDGIPTR